MSDCCVECFRDDDLKAYIDQNGENGECDFCGAKNVKCIDPYQLNDLFDPVVGLYEIVQVGTNILPDVDPSDAGDPLADRIDYDWEIWSEAVIDRRNELLDAIVNAHHKHEDEVDVTDMWIDEASGFLATSSADLWRSFARNLQFERRYVPKEIEPGESADPRELLEDALPKVEAKVPGGTELFRARLGVESEFPLKPYAVENMGAPPNEITRGGRMNPPGIPYLYLAFSEETAIAEVRPWKGAYASSARYVLPTELRIVDLTDIPGIKPFGGGDLRIEVDEQHLLRSFGRELSRPVNPNAADIDYVPTQYLTELIQDFGFEAIQYPSALGAQPNLVIFEHNGLKAEKVWVKEVTEINYKSTDPERRHRFDDYF